MNRVLKRWRTAVIVALIGVTPCVLRGGEKERAPDFDRIKSMARDMAAAPYKDMRRPLSKKLRELSYDQMRDIRYDTREAVWRRERLPFQMQFFHPAAVQADQIYMHLVDGERVEDFLFDRSLFVYGPLVNLSWMDLRGVTFSGFRIHYPLNTQEYLDELVVFQGASYFRALPKGLIYGISARAIAVNCGVPTAEEFPRFEDFWVYRPSPEGRDITLMGLFDGPSLSGAAAFVIVPGVETVMRTKVAVYARTNMTNYGIAPLSSMYWFGKNNARRFDDFRPEVHDSDGLLINNGNGEWLWRPLENNGRMRLTALADENPKGFGLIQRERSFACYQDLECNYHRRPSVWIRPVGNWGKGAVRLMEIPTDSEFHDNIVAFWEPEAMLQPGQSAEYAYDIVWYNENDSLPPRTRLISMRSGAIPGTSDPRARKFVLEFAWPAPVPEGEAKPEASVSLSNGHLSAMSDEYNAYNRTWRVAFDVRAAASAEGVELRAELRKNGTACSETWTYLWTP